MARIALLVGLALMLPMCVSLLGTDSSRTESSSREEQARAEELASKWHATQFTDSFGDRSGEGGYGPATRAKMAMDWPYDDVTARLYFECDSGAWIRFDHDPNISARGEYLSNGYKRYVLPGKIDDVREDLTIIHDSGESDISFVYDSFIKAAWRDSNTFSVGIPWHGNGVTVFEFDTRGAAKVMGEACK